MIGPSAVAIAPGVAYVGNRGDGTICAIDAATLRKGACFALGAAGLAASADGTAYVPSTKELWVTGAPPRTDRVVALDAGRGGAKVGEALTGGGVDNIDYVEERQELFVAAADVARLTVIRVGDGGALTAIATGETARFARVVVADDDGRAYVADPAGGRILVFER